MGVCGSKSVESQANKKIEAEMRKENRADMAVKLLLLGTGDSGKSTIFKQIRILYEKGFDTKDKARFKEIIHQNVWANIEELVRGCEQLQIPLTEEIEKLAGHVMDLKDNKARLDPTIAATLTQLWNAEPIQHCYKNRAELQLFESAGYFFKNLSRISDFDFCPTDEDILRARVRTTGIVNETFCIDDTNFVIYDVGGQRNERRKWIHCFDNVHAVLFVVSLSEYDQKLFEDTTVNRLNESLGLFSEISNSRFFSNTAVILFLNKCDLFKEKIQQTNITTAFPEYKGPQEYEAATDYIKGRFESLRKSDQAVYTHITCATNSKNMKFVFGAVKDIMFEINMKLSGFA